PLSRSAHPSHAFTIRNFLRQATCWVGSLGALSTWSAHCAIVSLLGSQVESRASSRAHSWAFIAWRSSGVSRWVPFSSRRARHATRAWTTALLGGEGFMPQTLFHFPGQRSPLGHPRGIPRDYIVPGGQTTDTGWVSAARRGRSRPGAGSGLRRRRGGRSLRVPAGLRALAGQPLRGPVE